MKEALRKEILKIRSGLSETQVNDLSRKIFLRLCSEEAYRSAKHIMIYLDFRKEVKTIDIINHSLKEGKEVYVPVCVPETRQLVISRIHGTEDLEQGYYGILEPKKQNLHLCDSNILDLVLVPGSVFDEKGGRIGYGAGYYDKFFNRLKKPVVKAALAYSFQVVENVPISKYDVPMDMIITEKKTIRIKI